jgi:hypothetical protein
VDHRRPGAEATSRALARAAAAGLSLLLLTACANDTDAYPHGEEAASWTNGSIVRTVLLYVAVPALVLLAIAALAWLPAMLRAWRYRPREGWDAQPVWFSGPPDPAGAVSTAATGDVTRGGAGGDW